MTKHLYLFTLELTPMNVGDIYGELPLHCTLMYRFWSELSVEEMVSKVRPLFNKTPQITLIAYEHALIGPKQMSVSLLEQTEELQSLNMQLYELLNELGAEYTAPQWVGRSHQLHVTDRDNEKLEVGSKHVSRAAYLIEVGPPEQECKRIVRTKFELKGAGNDAQPFNATEYWPDTESKVCFIPSDVLPSLPMTVAVIYAFQDEEILLIKNDRGWDVPGGHIELGETPKQAATRELMEEAGATVERIQLVGYLKVTKLKENEHNKVYPKEGAIIVYKGSGIQFHKYEPQFEATERMMLSIEQLPSYHHNWSKMKQQIVTYVRGLADEILSLGK